MTDELLAKAGPDLLDRLVATARSGNAAGEDPVAGRFIATCLLRLATMAGADDDEGASAAAALARHLVGEPTADVRCELHLIQTGGAGDRENLSDLTPAAALLRAEEAAGTADLGVEVLAALADGHAVLALLAKPGGALEYAFPAIGRTADPSDDTIVFTPPPAVQTPGSRGSRASTGVAGMRAQLTDLDNEELVQALRSAMSEVAVQVDFGEVASVAERVVDRLSESMRVPSAHDVADVIAPLIPTAGDVAEIVSERVTEHLPAVPVAAIGEVGSIVGQTTVNIAHLELELATLHDQLQAAQRSFASLTDELGVSGRRARDQNEALSSNLSEEMHRLGRRVDERLQELATSNRASASAATTGAERELRASVASLDAAVERLEALMRRADRGNDTRTIARLTRTLQVLVTRLQLDDDLPPSAEPVADPGTGADEPLTPRPDNPLRLIGRDTDSGSAAG